MTCILTGGSDDFFSFFLSFRSLRLSPFLSFMLRLLEMLVASLCYVGVGAMACGTQVHVDNGDTWIGIHVKLVACRPLLLVLRTTGTRRQS